LIIPTKLQFIAWNKSRLFCLVSNGYRISAAHGEAPLAHQQADEQTSKRTTKERQAAETLKEFLTGFLEIKLTDLLIALFTIVLAIKTAGLFRETAGLREAAEKQRMDSLRSIAAGEIAAAAAQKAAEVAEKTLIAAYRPIITIVEFELRNANQKLPQAHIHWGMRNSGQGTFVVTNFAVAIAIRAVGDGQAKTVRSVTTTEWLSTIEPRETASGNTVSTPTLDARVADIKTGKISLFVTIEIAVQDLFLERSTHRFPFIFESSNQAFRRVNAGDDGPNFAG
jgi:hypothetical protein